MQIELSVIVCTHNPRPEYLQRVLDALAAQTLPRQRWELHIIDNASSPGVSARIDVKVPPNPEVVIEPTLGLTAARLCGIRTSAGAVIVFVDDDNVLHSDYLAHALELGSTWPQLGTWGGQAFPEWEEMPPEWTRRYWNWIGIREFAGDLWSNIPNDTRTAPFGAGMCVRRRVAEAYASALEDDPVRRGLGRTGTRLTGSEDSDIAFTACDLGLGNGIFERLKLTHLIPKRRTEESYLLQLVESLTLSHTLLLHRRGIPAPRPSRAQRLLEKYQALFVPARDRSFDAARARGRAAALEEITRAERNGAHT
jgi:glycosyltransferase involved in cell wall biosynthesis